MDMETIEPIRWARGIRIIRLCVRHFDSFWQFDLLRTQGVSTVSTVSTVSPLAWYWEFAKLHTRSLRTLASEYNRNLRPQLCQTSCSPASARLHPPNKEWWLDKHFHLPRRSEKQKTRSFGPWHVANKVDTCQELQKRLPSDLLWNPYRSVSCAIHRRPCPPADQLRSDRAVQMTPSHRSPEDSKGGNAPQAPQIDKASILAQPCCLHLHSYKMLGIIFRRGRIKVQCEVNLLSFYRLQCSGKSIYLDR